MYARSLVHLPFPAMSTITPEVVREIKAIEDFKITYSNKDIFWIEQAINNLEYMISLAIALEIDTTEMEKQKAQFESSISTNGV